MNAAGLPDFDRAISARNLCVGGLLATWIISLSCIGFASYSLNIGQQWTQQLYNLPNRVGEVLPLLFNLIITLCADCLGYIHGTSLRWALWRENRLEFNSNLRLFTGSKTSAPNSAIVNAVSAGFLVLTYTGSSQAFLYFEGGYSAGSPVYFMTVNSMALAALGIGLFGQACIATWALCSAEIPTWSSNPLNTTLACLHWGLTRHLQRCMLSATAKNNSGPISASRSQGSALEANSRIKWPIWLTWILTVVCFAWASIVVVFTIRSNGTFKASFPLTSTSSKDTGFGIGGPTWNTSLETFLSLLLIGVVQSGLTLGLHCIELIVNISRDEDSWRLASRWMTSSKETGADRESSSVKSAFTSWQTVGLLVLKALMHWLFGLGMTLIGQEEPMPYTVNYSINMRAIPLFALAACGFVLAVCGTWLVRYNPEGPQPSAWGKLQTLADLVDHWDTSSTTMYWGDKDFNGNGTRHAGTSSLRSNIGRIHFDELYE
jgi:hypothetical protein